MTKSILIENVEAAEIQARFDTLEAAIAEISRNLSQPATPTDCADYITRQEVAGFFKITLTTVHDWTRKGILQAYKAGNRVYYKRSEVEAALTKKGGRYE